MSRRIYASSDLLLVESTMLDEEDDEIAPQAAFMAWELGDPPAAMTRAAATRAAAKPAAVARTRPAMGGGRSLESLMGSAPAARKKKGKKKGAGAADESGSAGGATAGAAAATESERNLHQRDERSEPKVIASNWRNGPQRTVSQDFSGKDSRGGEWGQQQQQQQQQQQRGRGQSGEFGSYNSRGSRDDGYYDGGGDAEGAGGFFQDLEGEETRDAPWRKPDMVPFDFDAFSASVPTPAPQPAQQQPFAHEAVQSGGGGGGAPPGMPGLLQSMFKQAAAASPAAQPAAVAPTAMPGLLQSMFMAAAAQPAAAAGAASGSSVFSNTAPTVTSGSGVGFNFGMFGGGQAPLKTPTPSHIMSAADLEQRWGR